MAPKSKRSWFDIQMAIMTIAMAAVLGLWNLFAGPDRETAAQKAAEEFANQQNQLSQQPVVVSPAPLAQPAPAVAAPPQPGEKIMLGGAAPQTQIFVQGGGGGNRGNGGGGGTTTSTRSS